MTSTRTEFPAALVRGALLWAAKIEVWCSEIRLFTWHRLSTASRQLFHELKITDKNIVYFWVQVIGKNATGVT